MARVNDAGFKALLKNLKNADGLVLEAGIFSDAKASKSKNGSRADNLAYRLKVHDQGLGNNPQREVLQPAVKIFLRDYNRIIQPHFKRLDKSGSFDRAYKSAGQRLSATIKDTITKRKRPAKQEATIRHAQRLFGGGRKTNPLIQTGEMRRAVTFRLSRR